MVKFGERMKAARTAKHMSQQALADIIGKSLNTVGLYERGLRQPSLETLCLLADTLAFSSDYLLARTDDKRTATFSCGSELNKERPCFPEGGKALAADVHCTPVFLQK